MSGCLTEPVALGGCGRQLLDNRQVIVSHAEDHLIAANIPESFDDMKRPVKMTRERINRGDKEADRAFDFRWVAVNRFTGPGKVRKPVPDEVRAAGDVVVVGILSREPHHHRPRRRRS